MTRHVREVVVNGAAKLVGELPANKTMHFDVVLALRHQPELENFLQELYDPSSPSYKQYVTPQQFAERFGASQEDYDALIAFAKANGFKIIGGSLESRDVQFSAPVANVNKAFHITMGVYQHPTENRTFFSPDREPSADLPMQLWHITGLDNYSIPHPALQRRDTLKSEVSQAKLAPVLKRRSAAATCGELTTRELPSPAPARTSPCSSLRAQI
jgi:subtilase family serine protease